MNRLRLIFKFLFDKNIPLKEKWWVILPLVYILSPVDLIPAPILGFSIIDDAVMLVFLLTVVADKTAKYYGYNVTNKENNENIVENVEYEIDEINGDEDEK
ncbi:MAG TPA: hypothetical protein DC038_11465 [Clostridiales bacterium]|nr:hypothetical protein [Clostridiales bacterium]